MFMGRFRTAIFNKYITLIIKIFYRREENTETLIKCCCILSKFVKYVTIGLVVIISFPVLWIVGWFIGFDLSDGLIEIILLFLAHLI